MPNNVNAKIVLIGTGPMAVSYAKVLDGMHADYEVVGRGEASAEVFFGETGKKPVTGGIHKFFEGGRTDFTHAIIATGTEALAECLKAAIANGIAHILVEKPAAVSIKELEAIKDDFAAVADTILVAYNRRFYASVMEAERLIAEDGGLDAMSFEFTEWTHKIDPSKKRIEVLNNWFFANSTHVVDMAFFLAGKPADWAAFARGGSLDWHDKTIYSGAGITEKGVLFSYLSHWESAGRWGVELLTSKRKIVLKPLEGVLIQPKGTITAEPHLFDDEIDKTYKPGLYRQVEAFLKGDRSRFVTIAGQLDMALQVYSRMLS